jgi:exosortase/archaeosortase family protein
MANLKFSDPSVKFTITFLLLFAGLYGFYLFYLGITSPGNYYSAFLDNNLNFIQWLRCMLLNVSAGILSLLGYQTRTNATELLVVGRNIIIIGHDCLAIGVMCFFTAFVLAYPRPWPKKLVFLATGLTGIQTLNIARFVLLSLFYKKNKVYIADQHTLYNVIVYVIIAITLYFWIKRDNKPVKLNASN